MLLDRGKAQTNYIKKNCDCRQRTDCIQPKEARIWGLETNTITPRLMQVKAIDVVLDVRFFSIIQLIVIFARFFSRPLA